MARLSLMHPGNHRSAERIGDEFENLARYLVAAEIGGLTLGEMMDKIFNDSGEVDGLVDIRLDTTIGLQYRTGEYSDPEEGWSTIVSIDSIRGSSGVDFGLIDAPTLYGREDITADGVDGEFGYAHDSDDGIRVYVNGVLQPSSNVTNDASADTVTLGSTPALNDVVTIERVRTNNITNYRRSDITSTASQAVFPFVHETGEVLEVFRNGILQIEGGANDYTTSPASDTVTFTSSLSAGEIVTIEVIESAVQTKVLGLMTEGNWTDSNGYIPYAKLAIADGDIPQAKVNGLVSALTNKFQTYVSASTPGSPTAGETWIDTSSAPPVLKFYNGVSWYEASPNINIPTFSSSNSLQNLRVNAAGTGLEWATIDTSALVPISSVGAANGVASLGSGGQIPIGQIPSTYAIDSLDHSDAVTGSVTDTTISLRRIFKQTIRIDGVAVKLSAGTCNVQVTVDGSPVGDIISVSSTVNDHTMSSSISIDASSASKVIGVQITGSSSASDLEVTLAVAAENA